MQKVVRKILTGTATSFDFDVNGRQFLVKNFSSGDIYVGLGAVATSTNGIKIPANCSQTCIINANSELLRSNTVSVLGTGEVEVQCVSW